MRIITGSARGAALKTLEGERTRPTAEKVKEAVFSALQFDLEGRSFLDLFAGSGQMGLEALSRGARRAVFIDESREAMEIVKENAKKTGFFDLSHFLVSDYRNYLRKAAGKEKFDIVFIDPPYAAELVGDALARILSSDLARPGCLLVCESGSPDIFKGHEEIASRFETVKYQRYGIAHVHILRLLESEASDA